MDNIEGDWKNFKIRFLTDEDIPLVLEHVKKYFMKDELTCQLIGYSEEFGNDMCEYVKAVLPFGLSLVVIDKDSGELAAIRITYIHSKDQDSIQMSSPQAHKIATVLEIIEKAWDPCEVLKVDSFVDLFIASTATAYRQLGIAGELYRRTLSMLKAKDLNTIFVRLSSPYTRKATAKWGFKQAVRIDFPDFRDSNGEQLFPTSTKEQFLSMAYKIIEPQEIF